MIKPRILAVAATAVLISGCQSSSDPTVKAHNAEFGCIAGTVGGGPLLAAF